MGTPAAIATFAPAADSAGHSTVPDDVARARAIVLRHGHNATAYQTLNPGFRYFFSPTRDAVTAYVPRGRTWVAAGPPVCATPDLPHCTAEFESAAADDHCAVCYTCATDRLRALLLADPARYSLITLGAEPVWDPRLWPDLVKRERSIRSQINRARNKHVTAAELPASALAYPQGRALAADAPVG